MNKIFITGIGTGIGKTLVSAILIEALQADYWKPVQAGIDNGTDSEWIKANISNKDSIIHPELFKLTMPASPHIAARKDNLSITVNDICKSVPSTNRILIIEGAGGLLVPFNDQEFNSDLIKALKAKVVIVSRNYLGSINHSLLTAKVCKEEKLDVMGWIFNDQYLDYEKEIERWSGFPGIYSIPYCDDPGTEFIKEQAKHLAKWIKPLL
jgi:dethiobiotin synthetase